MRESTFTNAICKAESKQISKDFAYCEDAVSRQAAIDKFIDGLEDIFADLRERHVDDSVCGLCEYDGAYIGQSGDWCNECPGFEKDDCFKLSDKTRKEWTEEIIKALPSAQPEPCEDTISRKAAIDAIKSRKTAEQSRAGIMRNAVVDFCIDIVKKLPSAQPERKKGR